MPTTKRPRSGSMQFWPRKKAKRMYARIRSWAKSKKLAPQAFVGYKVGMTHIMATQENKNSHLKGQEMAIPVTIVECPPMRIMGARFYKKHIDGSEVLLDVPFKVEKELKRKTKTAKENAKALDSVNLEEVSDITLMVYTQPSKAGFGKKKPEVIEVAMGGSNDDKINFLKENSDKEFTINQVFDENQVVDIKAVTKGKGTQGPVRRFGIGLRNHKSEKSIRNPGSLGPWVRQQHISHRVAHAGQTGKYQRTEYHKQILKISEEPESIGKDFHKYGNIKSTYILLHGSIPGAKKRAIIMTQSIRNKGKQHQLALND